MFRITSKLKLCGEKITNEDILEKIFFTFYASNLLLQQQYRERGFKKYSKLISCLLIAEQNNEILMKNHQSRLTDSSPFPEANATSFKGNHGQGRGRGRGPRRGRGRGRNNVWRRKCHNSKSNDNNMGRYGKENNSSSSKKSESSCYRCCMINQCRTPKHLVELYQASIKKKGKEVKINFIENRSSGILMDTHLYVSDFFENVDKEIDIMN
jgi:hypothetical protein